MLVMRSTWTVSTAARMGIDLDTTFSNLLTRPVEAMLMSVWWVMHHFGFEKLSDSSPVPLSARPPRRGDR